MKKFDELEQCENELLTDAKTAESKKNEILLDPMHECAASTHVSNKEWQE